MQLKHGLVDVDIVHNRWFYSFLAILIVIITVPIINGNQVNAIDWDAINQEPSLVDGHWFGTDELGRDFFLRTMLGGQTSLFLGLSSALVAVTIGLVYGVASALSHSITDGVMLRIMDIMQSLPFTFLVIVMISIFGNSVGLVIFTMAVVSWPDMARIVRSQTLSLKEQPFIGAARLSGCSSWIILWKHILPNLMGIFINYTIILIPHMIILESFLSFLGLGTQEPQTSWGALIYQGTIMMGVANWLLIFPILCMVATLLCLYFWAEHVRKLIEPRKNQLTQ